MLNLATVMRRRTARSKSQTSGRVLGSNWEPRMKKRRVSKRIANSFTVLVVRQFAFALGRKRIRRRRRRKLRVNSPHVAHSVSGLCNAVSNDAEDV